jgi:adenine-specific DNA-methyltransferase
VRDGVLRNADSEYRKSLGVFYTPQWIAEALVDWALRSNVGPILDPSFGGCAFLRASLDTLRRLHDSMAGAQIFGFDIDPKARRFAQALISAGIPRSNLVQADFLNARSIANLPRLAAVVGNPPYIRHHAMSATSIDRAQRLLLGLGVELQRTASAWAYFTIIAADCLRDGGRLALILPGTLLHAEYARDVIERLKSTFGSLRLLHLRDRLFEYTDEESIIVLASDKGSHCSVNYRRVSSAADLLDAIVDDSRDFELRHEIGYKSRIIPGLALEALNDLRSTINASPLGDVGRVRIGVVTGANDFFVRAVDDPLLSYAAVESVPILTNRTQLTGLKFTRRQMRSIERGGSRSRLAVIRPGGRKCSSLKLELGRAERRKIPLRSQCWKRSPWYTISDVESPDLFLPYMGSRAPFLVMNAAGATCTNAIHRFWLHEGCRASAKSAVVSSFSSMFELEAELFGRHYGGGILKIEPAVAARLSVATEGGDELFDRMTKLHEAGRRVTRSDVDDALFSGRVSKNAVSQVRDAIWTLNAERNGFRPS